MDTFDTFSPVALGFLKDLKANNTRDWFTANKLVYEETLKAPSNQFAAEVVQALNTLTGQNHSSKVFRIHRDVRFSKDKTPYKAHLHIAFTPETQSVQPPMWFFGFSPEKTSLGCGVFQYQKDALPVFREAMAGSLGSELIGLVTELRTKGIRIGEPDLKRVPFGFDKEHPNSEVLRRKGIAAWNEGHDPSFATEPDLVTRTIKEFRVLLPMFQLLSRIG